MGKSPKKDSSIRSQKNENIIHNQRTRKNNSQTVNPSEEEKNTHRSQD